MPKLNYSLITNDGEQEITVILPGGEPQIAFEDHPSFSAIKALVLDIDLAGGDADLEDVEDLQEMFDAGVAVGKRFERLSERVTVLNGHVYFDGDEVHSALAEQILRVLEVDGSDSDFIALVNFFERVQTNPNSHSREQLYDWLAQHDFTITKAGYIVGYKGVRTTDAGYESIHRGPAIVNGEPVNGAVPNNVGDVVEMARSQVAHDPSHGCSSGLHVGTYDYAKGFSQGAVLEVHVDPRDVVSVPTDCSWAKVRTCRYTVVGAIDTPYSAPVLDVDGDLSDEYVDSFESLLV